MKTLIGVLLALALAVGAGIMTHNEPGYVFLGYGELSIETTLAVLLGATILLFLVLHLLVRLLAWVGRVPGRLREGSIQRRAARSRRLLNKGLLELSEGHWLKAERVLAHPDLGGENLLLAALLAALAAQEQHADERRDQYLRDAVDAEPGAEIAVSLVQAELQFSRRQFEQALANLNRLRVIAPRQDRVPRMLAKVLRELGDWRALAELMPEVRKRALFSESTTDELELKAWRGLLGADGNVGADQLRSSWNALPKRAHEHPQLVRDYVAALRTANQVGDAESVIVAFLDRRWDDGLIEEYGLLASKDPARQLDQAERWHRRHQQNPAMLLTLGRLCMRRQLWGKARNHLEASVRIQPLAETYLELGRLLQRIGEKGAASDYYRKGLSLALQVSDTPLPTLKREADDPSASNETKPTASAAISAVPQATTG